MAEPHQISIDSVSMYIFSIF